MVFAPAPDIIDVQQPPRRRPGADRLADVEAGPEGAKLRDQSKHGIEITAGRGIDDAFCPGADAIEFEKAHAAILDRPHTELVKSLVVFWPGQGKPAGTDLKTFR